MKPGSILFLIGAAAAIGWYAPDIGALHDASDSARGSGSSTDSPSGSAWNAGQTTIPRESDGHFYAQAMVDDAELRFLVDTGASMVALTGADAEAAGLTWSDADLRPVGKGASGTVYGVPVTLDRMELGGFEARDVRAAIIPEGLGVSLLGQSFLSRMSGVEIAGDEMRLGAS